MKNKFIYIKGFEFSHLLHSGIYRIIWSGIITQFGYTSVYGQKNDDMRLTVGTKIPFEFSGEVNYNAYYSGYIFGKCIIIYKKYEV